MTITTDRLELIPLTIEDLEDACCDQEKVFLRYGFIGKSQPTTAEMQSIYRLKIMHMEQDPANQLFSTYFWIKDRKTQQYLGELGFKGFQESFFSVEIGYGMVEAFRGKGYMTEAVYALVQWAFSMHIDGLLYIIATTNVDNLPSQRVLEKVGFRQYANDKDGIQWMIDVPRYQQKQE